MRRAIASVVLGLVSASTLTGAALAEDATKSPPPTWVHLDSPADLEHLRETNFNHYLRAKQILAAANEICHPGPEKIYPARFVDADPYCGMMWMTSYPPKKLLSFRLDAVHYIALVTVTSNLGKTVAIADAER